MPRSTRRRGMTGPTLVFSAGYEDVASTVDERPVVLITTVDIGGGESDRIVMRRGDNAATAAREFVQRHGLSESVLDPLTKHMKDNLVKAKRDAKVCPYTSCAREPCLADAHVEHTELSTKLPTMCARVPQCLCATRRRGVIQSHSHGPVQ